MRKPLVIIFYALFFISFSRMAIAKGDKSVQPVTDQYDLYLYRPFIVGTVWVYNITTLKEPPKIATMEVLREETYDSHKVKVIKQPSNWIDFYEESNEGLKRPRDINTNTHVYGTYEPPAIQYPRYIVMGKEYKRIALRKNFKEKDNSLISSNKEELKFTLIGIEDITVPMGVFKNCIKTIADFRAIDMNGQQIKRKVDIRWDALNVGTVKGISIKLDHNNEIIDVKVGELKSKKK